jgi:peptide/nickel transport system permease protein
MDISNTPASEVQNEEPQKKKKKSPMRQAMKRFFRNRGAVVGLILLTVIILLALFAPFIAPYGYANIDIRNKFSQPSSEHFFGTDHMGRDIFSRILYGGRASLQIGFLSSLIAILGGMTIGSIAGYFGGVTDNIMMRALDVIQAMPGLLLSVVISAVLGTGLYETIIALSIGNLATSCRLMRGSVLTIRKSEYIDAAIVDNTNRFDIIRKHILPNAFSPLIVQATMGCARAILVAASLSFIGLGVRPPNPEWGAMLSEGRNYIRDYPYIITAPGIAIMLTVLSFNLLGDGLRDALDPKLKR